jgi:hypothetical protein
MLLKILITLGVPKERIISDAQALAYWFLDFVTSETVHIPILDEFKRKRLNVAVEKKINSLLE